MILPDLDPSHPEANVLNSSRLARRHCKDFRNQCEELLRKNVYEHQQKQYINLMEELERVPQQFHSLPFHKAIFNTTPVNALSLEAQAHLWHQRLMIHCGDFNFKDLHTKVDGISNPNKFEMDELSKCSTCMRTKLTKSSAGHRSLRDRVTKPYQLIYADHAFSGRVRRDEEGNKKE